jgi:hypothetical protein
MGEESGMFRFLARVVGLLLVAASFVGLVVDATGSIVNSTVSFTPLADLALTLFPQSFPLIESAVTRHAHPWLWDPVLLNLFRLPASLVGFVLGVSLLWLGQKPPEPIGYRVER